MTLALLKIAAAGTACGLLYGAAQGRGGRLIRRTLSRYSRGVIRDTLRKMRLRGLIDWSPDDEMHPIALTTKGWRKLALKERPGSRPRQKEWDLLWRILVFDISLKRKRESIRRDLRRLGWRRLQQSVYVHPLPDRRAVDRCIEHHRLSRQCVIFTAADLGPFDARLRRYCFGRSP
jgi:DNA-binding transcriptional regulator PaaX